MVKKAMAFSVRLMRPGDISQILEVERNAFPTLWPPTPFKRELQNKLARYFVAIQREDIALSSQDTIEVRHQMPQNNPSFSPLFKSNGGAARSLLSRLRRLWPINGVNSHETKERIVGYLGMWYMVDDAHIVAVGVREAHRRHGIGELLMIYAIEDAMKWRARSITLEVRVSNHAAQTLYDKYGFKREGVRKRYYSDNNEDAFIMTTDSIRTEKYQQLFQELKRLHAEKWGDTPPL